MVPARQGTLLRLLLLFGAAMPARAASWYRVDASAVVCQSVPSKINITYDGLDASLPHIVAIQRESSNPVSLQFGIRDAANTVVVPDRSVALLAVPGSRRLGSDQDLGAARDEVTLSEQFRRLSSRRRGGGSSWGSSGRPSPRPSPRQSPQPSPRPSTRSNAGGSPRRRGSTSVARPVEAASPTQRRRAATGIQGQQYTSPSVGSYGYSNQAALNSNYGGQPPTASSYGYSGPSAYKAGSTTTMVAAAAAGFAGGLIVGAGASYMWSRMSHYSPGYRKRLDSAGAHSGDIAISLFWDTYDNLDLRVTPPSGDEIHSGNKRSLDGGWLDVDKNTWHSTDEPVENVAWDVAPVGRYEVRVRFDSRSLLSSGPVDFTVVIRAVPAISDQQWPAGCEVLETSSSGTMVSCQKSIADRGLTEGVCAFEITNQAKRPWCVAPEGIPQAGELIDCDLCGRVKPPGALCVDASACLTRAGCSYSLPNAMNRDDLMEAAFTPGHFTPPLTLTVGSISGEDFSNDTLCNATATASRIYVILTQMERFGCDRSLMTPCTASTPSGCYDNEICQSSTCWCEPGACLDSSNLCVFKEDAALVMAGAGRAALDVAPLLVSLAWVLLRLRP